MCALSQTVFSPTMEIDNFDAGVITLTYSFDFIYFLCRMSIVVLLY